MAIEKQINIVVKENGIEAINKKIGDLSKNFDDASENIKGIKKSTETAQKGVKSLSDGFKGMGLAIKAIGIGLIIEAFNLMKSILGQNQVVVDLFSTSIGALSIAINDLTGFVLKNFPIISNLFKDVFENPTKYLKKFGDLIKENLIERFNSFLDTIGYLGDALKKVFEGDFAGAMDSVKQAGKESIDVLTGVNNTVDRTGKAVTDAANAIADYTVNTFKASAANIKLQNSALLAAAQQAKLVEQYDREAESLRQIRDNDLLSIADRIIANDKLATVLAKQQKAMLEQANLQVLAASRTLAMNKTIENQVALINAEANAEGVLAQIKGLKSEQLANENSLSKENIALGQSKLENLNNLEIQQKKFNESLQTDELKKLENQRANLEEEKRIELERLQLKIDASVKGTQARVDAENEYAIKSQEINNALTTNQIETNKAKIASEQAVADQRQAVQEAGLNAATSAVGLLSSLAGKNKAIQKAAVIAESAVGIGKMIIANNTANIGALATPQAIASSGASAAPVIAFNNISTGIGIAASLLATKKALTSLGGGGGGGGAEGAKGGGGPPPPSFNLVAGTGSNQIAEGIAGQRQPLQAYVVSGAVTNAQQMQRNIVEGASL
jgi:hypothetical protein